MEIKRRKFEFETNPATFEKSHDDFIIDLVKECRLLRLWQWWREDNEKYTRLMERR